MNDAPWYIWCYLGSLRADDDGEPGGADPGVIELAPPVVVELETPAPFGLGPDPNNAIVIRARLADLSTTVIELEVANALRNSTAGTVRRVYLTMPPQFDVAGSPVTDWGTLAVTWTAEPAARVLAGPASGVDALPTFRLLLPTDLGDGIPDATTFLRGDGQWAPVSTGVSIGLTLPAEFTVTSSPVGDGGTLAAVWASEVPNTMFAGPASGGPTAPGFRYLAPLDLGTGSASSATFLRGDLTWAALPISYPVSVTLGGTAADLHATGGPGRFVKQLSAGAAFTVDQILPAEMPTFFSAGLGHSKGAVPDPGATAHNNQAYRLGDDALWHPPYGMPLGDVTVATAQSTGSTTPVDLSTIMSITFTLDEDSRVELQGFSTVSNSAAGAVCRLDFDIDGADTRMGRETCNTASATYSCAGSMSVFLLAGVHTAKLQFSVSAGTGTFQDRYFTARYLRPGA